VLERLTVRGFKSLTCVENVELPRMAVLFGPNAAGKSNFVEAIQVLSRLAASRSLAEAFSEGLRGQPIEAFSFPPGGMPQLLQQSSADFELEATLGIGPKRYLYRVKIRINPGSGNLTVAGEQLVDLTAARKGKGISVIEEKDGQLMIRRRTKGNGPAPQPVGLDYTLLSDVRYGHQAYRDVEKCRSEISRWRTYYLDPRVAMRRPGSPAPVQDIGTLGEHVSSFLYHLRGEDPKRFSAVFRTLRTIIPSVEGLDVDLDERRGTLEILLRQGGRNFSSRIISEGTLRVIALSALAVNPWSGSLLAFEEPENGVHPRRLELIAELLLSLCLQRKRQVLVTTHSPLFASIILRRAREDPRLVQLFQVQQGLRGTTVRRFDSKNPLFDDQEIARALLSESEDAVFTGLLMRGLLDESTDD